MERHGDIAKDRISDWGRRTNLWSHDVLIALVLTVMAVGFIGLAWMSGNARPNAQIGAAKVVTTK